MRDIRTITHVPLRIKDLLTTRKLEKINKLAGSISAKEARKWIEEIKRMRKQWR